MKGTNNFSNCHSIEKHEASDKHQLAVEADLAANAPEKTPMVQAVARLTQQQNDKMLLLFRTAYCIIKQMFSLNLFAALLSLQKMNGVALGSAYSNGKAASTFINSIASVELSNLINSLNEKEFFSLLLDGSTDVSTMEQEIVYVRFMVDGRPKNELLGMMSVKQANAEAILEGLNIFMNDLGIIDWKRRLIALGTDGASVNVGIHGCLGALLKREIPHLLQVHCEAHKLELAVLDACKEIDYVNKFLDIVKGLITFYSHSSKRQRELQLAADILDSTIRKYGHWNPVHWIASKSRTMEVINENWLATVTHLTTVIETSNNKDAAVAKGLYKSITSVKFVTFLGFMCDYTYTFSLLSKEFQSDKLTLSSSFIQFIALKKGRDGEKVNKQDGMPM